jgi:prepilin-type N-terminal cleavage/methylation domain-containing protein
LRSAVVSLYLRAVRGRPSRQTGQRAFTLLEVMNALALTCIVGSLAMYFVARYVRHAKTAEAVGSVKAIAEIAATYYDASDSTQPAGTKPEAAQAMRHFPPTSRTSVPADPRDVRGRRYQSVLADWSSSPWIELRFSIPQPQSYAYSFESSGRGLEAQAAATAKGDLDGNGIVSTYRLTIAVDPTLHAKVATAMERQNAEE